MSTYRTDGNDPRRYRRTSDDQAYAAGDQARPLTPRQKAEQRTRSSAARSQGQAGYDGASAPDIRRDSQRISDRDGRYRALDRTGGQDAQAGYGRQGTQQPRGGARVQVSSPFTQQSESASQARRQRSNGQQQPSGQQRSSSQPRSGGQNANARRGTSRADQDSMRAQRAASSSDARQRGNGRQTPNQARSSRDGQSRSAAQQRAERAQGASRTQNTGRAQNTGRSQGADNAQTTPRATAGGTARNRASGSYLRSNEQNRIRRGFRAQRFLTRTLPAIAVIALIVFGVTQWVAHRPITVYVNDVMVELRSDRSAEHAVQMSGVKTNPGDLLDVEGEVLQEGGGTPYTLTVDGEAFDDATQDLRNGNHVTVGDGVDVEEESVTQENGKLPNATREEGYGPIHAIQPGKQGVGVIKSGKVSGKVVVVSVEQEPVDTVYLSYFPDVGDDKVVALTFDDGPVTSNGQTEELLDVLKDNGAVATFFTIGEQIEGAGIDAVIREHNEGHQVCTHTWDHAAGSGQGVNLSYMTADEQREEIEKGIRAIANAIGEEPSRAMRAPGGNFPIEVWQNVDDLITADLGWNIDTMDWSRPGAGYIAEQIQSAQPGDIILMHDGGGDRSQTIEALRIALPYLREQGFRFITIDELLQYPPLEE